MSKYVPLPIIPAPIPERQFSQAGDINMGQSLRRVASAYNYVSAGQRKMVFCLPNYIGSVPAPTASPTNNHYFVFRTGANVESVNCMLALWPGSATSGSNAASCELVLYDGTNTLTSGSMKYPTISATGGSIQWAAESITTGLLPNTKYRGHIRQNHRCRVVTAMVYEKASAVTNSSVAGVCDPLLWETSRPITDAACQDLAQTGDELFRRNGAQLISWSRHTEATAPTFAGTTQRNILNTATTAWSATSPGFVLNTEYLGSYNGDVKVELGVYANRTAGSAGLNVYVKRNGSTIISATNIGNTSPFDANTFSITARASDKVDIHCSSVDGFTTWRVNAVGLWLYEA